MGRRAVEKLRSSLTGRRVRRRAVSVRLVAYRSIELMVMPDAPEAGAVVLGVSKDSLGSHAKFATKYDLPFDLLADTDHAVAERYGSWGEKTFRGRKTIGMLCTIVLIDPEGRIARAWSKVQPEGHAQEVLDAIREQS